MGSHATLFRFITQTLNNQFKTLFSNETQTPVIPYTGRREGELYFNGKTLYGRNGKASLLCNGLALFRSRSYPMSVSDLTNMNIYVEVHEGYLQKSAVSFNLLYHGIMRRSIPTHGPCCAVKDMLWHCISCVPSIRTISLQIVINLSQKKPKMISLLVIAS